VLEVYGGFKMKPIEVVKTILPLGDQNIESEFVVINKIYDSKSIIGLRLLRQFELLKNINVIDKNSNGLDINNFIEMNRDVFEGVGCFPDIFELTMKEGVTPKASIARRVPIKIKDKLKLKLDELVKKEIIAPTDEPSEWVNNLVIVQKPDLSLRIRLDPQELNKG